MVVHIDTQMLEKILIEDGKMCPEMVAKVAKLYVETKKNGVISAGIVSDYYVSLMNSLILDYRLRLKHRAARTVAPHDKTMWSTLLKVTENALHYANSFWEQDTLGGLKEYINYGVEFMYPSYMLSKFVYNYDNIMNWGELSHRIRNDRNADMSKRVGAAYHNALAVGGFSRTTLTTPDVYICYVLAAEQIVALKADPSAWISAQFDGLRNISAYPIPGNLHGVNAQDRFNKFRHDKKIGVLSGVNM